MKAILKIIWFALTVVILQRFGSNIFTAENVGVISDKLTAYFPAGLQDKFKLGDLLKLDALKQLTFVILLFLGLDIISGDIKGIIKGPIKLAFNCVLYLVGFSVLFFILNGFSIAL
ncbi:hypothetical protein KHQ81_05935 [Mycoplasmatota bacterium]|nr:hypothetical protein KHQ81_05935 [Mycoplasmatota bacterium]